jgi:hypothetical protein
MEQTRFPWFWVIFLLISTVSAIVAYDLYSSPTVKGIQLFLVALLLSYYKSLITFLLHFLSVSVVKYLTCLPRVR